MEEAEAGLVNVAKYVIKKTPMGHLGKSLENLKALVGEKVLDSDAIKNELHNYGETHQSEVPNDVTNTKVVISSLTKDAEGFYYDQGQKVRFKIGLDSGSVENAEAIEFDNELRNVVEEKLKPYLAENFKAGIVAHNVYFDAAANKMVVLISAHNINLKNFWSGEWISSWVVDLSTNKVNGAVKADTYYYEEGNVQFSVENKFDTTITGDNATIAAGLIEFIKTSENSVQLELENVYDHLSDVYIKPLRRAMPVTQTRMNWNLNQIRIGQNS